jgi:hypothetical protein
MPVDGRDYSALHPLAGRPRTGGETAASPADHPGRTTGGGKRLAALKAALGVRQVWRGQVAAFGYLLSKLAVEYCNFSTKFTPMISDG